MPRWRVTGRNFGRLRLRRVGGRRSYRPPLGPDPLAEWQHAVIDKASLWEILREKLRAGARRRGHGQ